MACNSYQTYPSGKHCGCGRGSDSIYFPDFVANSCCNPCCEAEDWDSGEGCHICNGGGCGHWDGGSGCGHDRWDDCGCASGRGCSCGRYRPWQQGCCGACDCGCHSYDPWYPWYPWYPGCHNGICPRSR